MLLTGDLHVFVLCRVFCFQFLLRVQQQGASTPLLASMESICAFFFLLRTVTCCLSILTVSCSYLFRQCVCVHMCCCVCAYVCAHSCRGQLWVLVFAFHLLWGKASCLLLYVPACPTHKLLKTLLCLPSVSPEEYCDYRCLLPCSAFSMFSASNLGHLTCVASILPTFKLLLKGFTSN